MKRLFVLLSIVIAGFIAVLYMYFAPVATTSTPILFTVPHADNTFDPVGALGEQGIVKNVQGFRFLYLWFSGGGTIGAGGYRLDKSMNSWQIMKKVTGTPDLLWVTIIGCQRKEQIGEKIAQKLGWDTIQLDEWNNSPDEGIYYPDTYLIPVDESATVVRKRFEDRFQEKFAPLADEYVAKDIKWTTGLKIASLIARESGGVSDMKLISGVIWNRLDENMLLQIDATMQYTQGKREDGSWWGPVKLSEKLNESSYNSYLHKGLPPTPICSPSIDFVEAALNPEETDCLFYLHDHNKQIHCAVTYEEHKANIGKYLQ